MNRASAAPRHEFTTERLVADGGRLVTVAYCHACTFAVPVGIHFLPPCPGSPPKARIRVAEAA